MALSRKQMYDYFIERCGKIQKLFNNNDVDDRQIFEELCCSIYSGDEYDDVHGLIDALSHIVVADYAINTLFDDKAINKPDHSEILATICAQLKNSGVKLLTVYSAISKTDTFNWFVTNKNELSMVYLAILEIWDSVNGK